MKFIFFCLLSFSIVQFLNCNEIKQKFFSGYNGTIAAFGDFNSDKFSDIFLINWNQKCFRIILQIPKKTESDQQIFEPENKYPKLNNICVDNQIVSIIPSDFDGDALMDVAIVTKSSNGRFNFLVFKGTKYNIEENLLFKNNENNITTQPMLLDYNGDMISDLLVTEINPEGDTAYFVYLGGKAPFERIPFDQKRPNIKVVKSNSNAFIDLDGDGVSDIFLEEEGDEFYYYIAGKHGYTNENVKKIKKPNYDIIGSSTFCDINSDEKIDHLIPVCKIQNEIKICSIVVYDRNNSWTELVKEIKIGDDYFLFEENTSKGEASEINLPIRLRHGYVNENGNTDLMALMQSSKYKTWHVVLFNNLRNGPPNGFNINFLITVLNNTSDVQPILATFFDLYEDGVIDILVNYKNNSSKFYVFKSLTLNAFADVNFVKILVTSGLCANGDCYEKKSFEDTYKTTYGTNSPGSMVCYQLVDSNSNAMKSCGGQLSQSSNFALQMPYTVFGLGLYANYIEKLSVTIPTGNTSLILRRRVEQIVPDSQIVFIPNPIDDPSSWKVKLFLTPSDIIYKTLYTLTGICILLIVLIGVLHRKEMLEDVKEQAEFKKQWPEFRR